MTPRERTLAILLVGAIVLCGGALLGYMFVYSPLQAKWTEADQLNAEIADLDAKVNQIARLRPRIAEVKRQSLPPDPGDAKLQYQQVLERLRPAGLASPGDFTVKVGKPLPNTPPITPALAPKKGAYERLEFIVDIDNATIWQIVDFMSRFYQLNLLHQITELKITRKNAPTSERNGLSANIHCEAIIIDGVEPRRTLFPVTSVVGAVAGTPGMELVAHSPTLALELMPSPTAPVLATRGRDYSLIPKYDMFYGPLPPPVTGPPFELKRIADHVVEKPDEPSTVKYEITGRGAAEAKITAEVKDGEILERGPLEVDTKTRTIKIPQVTGELGSEADALVVVLATPPDGEQKKQSFYIKMGELKASPEPPRGPDIAGNIKLDYFTSSSVNGETTWTAHIWDQANPFDYKITVGPKGILVTKLVLTDVENARPPRKTMSIDKSYTKANAANALVFSDEWSGTKRRFEVIALEDNEAVIVAELGGPAADAPAPKQFGKGGGRFPGGGFPRGGGRNPPQGKADPLAVVAGNPAIAVPRPTYYRWPLGVSLKDVIDPDAKNPHRLAADEVKKILQRVAEAGPLAASDPPASGN